MRRSHPEIRHPSSKAREEQAEGRRIHLYWNTLFRYTRVENKNTSLLVFGLIGRRSTFSFCTKIGVSRPWRLQYASTEKDVLASFSFSHMGEQIKREPDDVCPGTFGSLWIGAFSVRATQYKQ